MHRELLGRQEADEGMGAGRSRFEGCRDEASIIVLQASPVSFLRVAVKVTVTRNTPFLIANMSSGKYARVESSDLGESNQSNALRISSSHVVTFLKYATVGVLWLSGIYVLLLQTGVIDTLAHFDSSFRYQRGVTPLTSPLAVAMIIAGYAFD